MRAFDLGKNRGAEKQGWIQLTDRPVVFPCQVQDTSDECQGEIFNELPCLWQWTLSINPQCSHIHVALQITIADDSTEFTSFGQNK